MSALANPKTEVDTLVQVAKEIDYETFKDRIKDTEKGDLIEGEMKLKTPACYEHEDLFVFLVSILRLFAASKNLGKVMGSRSLVKINDRNGFEPDILFVASDRTDIIRKYEILGAPDVVVEIISKSSRIDDRVKKFMGYQKLGVKEYWLIDPDYKIAEFFALVSNEFVQMEVEDDIFRSKALPGFWLDVKWLFSKGTVNEYQIFQQILKNEN